jgi:hypothetical protein
VLSTREKHSGDLREAISLAALLGVERIVSIEISISQVPTGRQA